MIETRWLSDMREALARVRRYAVRGRAAFEQDELLQVWMIHHLQVLGEIAYSVSPETRQCHPDVPWAVLAAMRDVLVTARFDLDLDEVWLTVERDLPELERRLDGISGVR